MFICSNYISLKKQNAHWSHFNIASSLIHYSEDLSLKQTVQTFTLNFLYKPPSNCFSIEHAG